jgi:hypothetical protein
MVGIYRLFRVTGSSPYAEWVNPCMHGRCHILTLIQASFIIKNANADEIFFVTRAYY